MKGKWITGLVGAFAALLFFCPLNAQAKTSIAQASKYSLYIDGKYCPSNPYARDGVIMVPLRVIVNKAGYAYVHKNGTSTFSGDGKTYSVTVRKNACKFGGKTHVLSRAPEITDNRVYVPYEYLCLALNMDVTISGSKVNVKTAAVTPGPLPDVPAGGLSLRVNGKAVSFKPIMSGDTLMLPLRAIAEKLGYTYKTYSSIGCSSFEKNKTVNYIYWGRNQFPVGGEWIMLEKAATLKNNVLYVPASFIQKGFGAKVTVKNSVVDVTK